MNGPMSAALARNWWAMALRGFAGIVFGVIALMMPAAALLSLTWVFAAYLVVDGMFAIVAAIRAAEHHERWGLLLLEGILDLLLGAVVWVFPAGAVLGFVLVVAGWALVTGVLMLVSSFRLHGTHGRLWLTLGGLVSIIWGVLLAAAPFTGAVVLTWWLGAYAIAFGVVLLVLAFRLQRAATPGGADGRLKRPGANPSTCRALVSLLFIRIGRDRMSWRLAGAALAVCALAGCGTNPGERTTGGAGAGAATGAVIGAVGGPVGVGVGAAIGAGAGAIAGAETTPNQVNLGRPPWDNPNARVAGQPVATTAVRASARAVAAAPACAGCRRGSSARAITTGRSTA